jgi:hypothetical protein
MLPLFHRLLGGRNGQQSSKALIWILVVAAAQLVLCQLADACGRRASSKLAVILIDTITHGLHACLCWFELLILELHNRGASLPSPLSLYLPFMSILKRSSGELMLAFFVGTALDVDHFIAAGSWSLAAATNLPRRPFGHNLLFVILLATAVGFAVICVRAVRTAQRTKAIVLTSCLSHLSRDALKKGFTYVPLMEAHTERITLLLHVVILTAVLPFVPLATGFFALKLEPLFQRNSTSFGRLLYFTLACDVHAGDDDAAANATAAIEGGDGSMQTAHRAPIPA